MAKLSLYHLVFKSGDLPPLPIPLTQVKGICPAVAISYARQQLLPVRAGLQLHLGNPGKLLSEFIAISRRWCPQFMKINLLVKWQICRRALPGLGIARVAKP